MGVNSHKLLIMIMLVNTMIALGADMYYSPQTVDQQYLTREDTIAQEYATSFKAEEEGTSTN